MPTRIAHGAASLIPVPPVGREPGSPGWLPDPTRRHQIRYWTGMVWSPRVSDNGVRTTDPIKPAIG